MPWQTASRTPTRHLSDQIDSRVRASIRPERATIAADVRHGQARPAAAGLAVLLILTIMSFRIYQTHRVYSATMDEGVHIAAGLELLSRHEYTYSPGHTPVARLFASAGPYLTGARYQKNSSYIATTESAMRSGSGSRRNIELARLGVLPFFMVGGILLFLWTRRLSGDGAAVLAVLLYSHTPSVLAHSGLANTDAALMASFTALLLAFQYWLDEPESRPRTLLFGVAGGLAVGSKISAIPFFAVIFIVMLIARQARWRSAAGEPLSRRALPLRSFAGAILIGLATLYASYTFTIGDSLGFPAPLSEFVLGLMYIIRHNVEAGASYLLGETYFGSRWLFFPVALIVKSPVPLLVLTAIGLAISTRRWWRGGGQLWLLPVTAFATILVVACASNINLGSRHILPVFPVMAMLGSVAVASLWKSSIIGRVLSTVLVGWMIVGTWRSHPDYLPYFNEFGARDPGALLVDSDLDWGQDLERLADTAKARGIEDLSIAYYGFPGRLVELFPAARHVGPKETRPTGWFAVSETLYRRGWIAPISNMPQPSDSLMWLREHVPAAWVGKSIRLYNLPASDTVR
jgi:hypothetical protein